MSSRSPSSRTLWRDRLFWLAVTAGPLCWLVLYLLLRPATPQWTWPLATPADFLLPVLFYPVLEEIVFRGLLTSLVFTGFHFLGHAPLWAASVFFPSLVFGFFKDRYQALTAPILLHGFYNAGFLLIFTAPA